MKKSLAHLPGSRRRDLAHLVALIRKELPQVGMVILFGSYARGDYVFYDDREEFGVQTVFTSDYDLLVVTAEPLKNEYAFEKRVYRQFYKDKNEDYYTPLQLINMGLEELNSGILKSRPFYVDIKREGIMLYDSGELKLARRRKMNYAQIHEVAQEYYDEKFTRASQFLNLAEYCCERKEYVMGSFQLHQAAENYFHTILLVFTLYSKKQHYLKLLLSKAARPVPKVREAFPQDTPEGRRLLNLLTDAYVQARYNKDFRVAKEDMDALIPRVERLRVITDAACRERLAYYAQMANETLPE